MTDRLEQAVEEQKRQNQQEAFQISGLLGIPLGGQRRVEVPNRNAYVFVRLRSNQNEVIQAYNNQVSPSYNLPVIVERYGNKYIIAGVDSGRYENNWGSYSPFLPRHGNTHSFDLEGGGGGDVVWVQSRQIVPMLVFPSGSVGAENVIVHPYTLRNDNGTWRYVGNTGTSSLAPYRPSSPSGAVMALVYLDSDTGNPQLLINSGSIFSNTITGSSQIIPYIPSLTNPAKDIPLVAIRLITGTNQISWDNIYDLRQWLHTIPTGSTGGGAAAGIQGIPVQDEGVFVATGSVLNFVGDNVSATVSGSVIRVYVTGSTSGGSINTGTLDARYLKLDASNDPLTGALTMNVTAAEGSGFDQHALNINSSDANSGNGGLFVNTPSGSYAAWMLARNNGVLFLDQYFDGSENSSDNPLWITRRRTDLSENNIAQLPAILVDDYPDSGLDFRGGTIKHQITGSVVLFQANPQAKDVQIPYILSTQYAKPTGTIHTSFRVNNSEVARVDVSGTVFSNNVPLIKEAPSNGNSYVRKNAGWEVAAGGSAEVYFAGFRTTTQSVNNGTSVVIFNSGSANSHGYYDNTNGKFTPLASGTYFFDGSVAMDDLKDGGSFWVGVRKNGSQTLWCNAQVVGAAADPGVGIAVSVYLNGSTDYTEVVVFHDHGSARNLFGTSNLTRVACRRVSLNNIVGY